MKTHIKYIEWGLFPHIGALNLEVPLGEINSEYPPCARYIINLFPTYNSETLFTVRNPRATSRKHDRRESGRQLSDVTSEAQQSAADASKNDIAAITERATLDPNASIRRNPASLFNGTPAQNTQGTIG